ncbi:GWxTD domain-containing protein [Polluticoccus soli]|uniref:GWxTD domain-containing protein n=1 Tax=Polluticoccus soli TaxID=3034150 RepID=UPI0023E0966B|nr:GWxTD domain-containing protein [Flavipsychrobacter sp. JY13-12]
MTRWLGLCIALFLSFSASAIEAVVNHTIFYVYEPGKKMTPYLELSIQINPASVHFIQTKDSFWQSRIKTEVVLSGSDGTSKVDNFLLQTVPDDNFEAASSRSIIDVRRYKIPAGMIVLDVHLSEPIIAGNTFAFTDSFSVEAAPETPFYSGLQLLDTAYASSSESAFQKNGRQQIPLSSNFLNDDRRLLHFYTELYHTNKATDSLLIQKAFISRRAGDAPVLKLQHIDTLHASPVLPFIGQFNISSLPSGNYYLNTVLENSTGHVLTSRSLFFQRSNKAPAVAAADTLPDTGMQRVNILDLSTTFIGKYSFAQVKAILKMMLPIASPTEIRTINNFLNKPEDTYMRYFIYNFWKARNEKDPKKPWEEYTKLVKEVNKLFGFGSRPGYETDRGILYLKYGRPTEREIVANENGSLPYEIWQYNSLARQGSGGVLLFYNPQNMINDFRLLHSTINQEGSNPGWRSQLYERGSNPNARAELYFRNR